MAKVIENQYRPDYVSSPGESVLGILEALEMTPVELAKETGYSFNRINEVIQGQGAITPDMAIEFERVLKMPAHFWNNRERRYREFLEQLKDKEPLEVQIKWLDNFPTAELVQLDWIEDWQEEADEQLWELLYFFDVRFPKEWEKQWQNMPAVMYRRQSDAFKNNPYALAAWLRKGELDAEEIECAPYSKAKFRAVLHSLRALTTQAPEEFLEPLVQRCAEAGVALVFVPALSQISISGATRWLAPDQALIQLTLRYKSDDQLWFSFFHEAAHILLHDKQDVFLEYDEKYEQAKEEQEANQFAADLLIPPQAYQAFVAAKTRFSKASIRTFAQQIGIAPGIVVGRLQHDGHLPYTHGNALKRRLTWTQKGITSEQ